MSRNLKNLVCVVIAVMTCSATVFACISCPYPECGAVVYVCHNALDTTDVGIGCPNKPDIGWVTLPNGSTVGVGGDCGTCETSAATPCTGGWGGVTNCAQICFVNWN